MNFVFDEKISTPLCEIMGRNKSNKGHANINMSWHNYTPFYYANFKNMKYQPLRIFELGLGKTNTVIPSSHGGWDTVGVVGGWHACTLCTESSALVQHRANFGGDAQTLKLSFG